MLVLELREPGRAPRTRSFTRHTLGIGLTLPSLRIGRERADLALASANVLDVHLQLTEREGLLWLAPSGRVVVDGQAFEQGERAVPVGSSIEVADCTVVVKQFVPIVPADFEVSERELLELTQADKSDIGARLVYADALEEGGWLIRAEYLRVQVRLLMGEALEGDDEAHARFVRKLAPARRWLAAVGYPMSPRP